MDLEKIAMKMFMKKFGGSGGSDASAALEELTGRSGKFDIADIVGKFTGAGGDIEKKAQSWLSDGTNDSISTTQLNDVIGADKIDAFAAKLGINANDASGGLAELLPELIDKSSCDGSLLRSVGGTGGLAGLASKFFR
ncbi:MAG: YidB family protein [Woeseiaceae bacterium]